MSGRSAQARTRFPRRNLIGMDIEMLGQLGDRPVAFDGGSR
jgi:hypothetical protein